MVDVREGIALIRFFAICSAGLLLVWWVQFGSPCDYGTNRLTTAGAWGTRPIVCFYNGPLLKVRLPSGKLADLYAGHVFGPPEGYPVVAMYDQSEHYRTIYQSDMLSAPILIGDVLHFGGSETTTREVLLR